LSCAIRHLFKQWHWWIPPPDIEEKSGARVEFAVDTDEFSVGQVLAGNDGQVKVDFNHLLIGENVKFEVEGLAVIERDG